MINFCTDEHITKKIIKAGIIPASCKIAKKIIFEYFVFFYSNYLPNRSLLHFFLIKLSIPRYIEC